MIGMISTNWHEEQCSCVVSARCGFLAKGEAMSSPAKVDNGVQDRLLDTAANKDDKNVQIVKKTENGKHKKGMRVKH